MKKSSLVKLLTNNCVNGFICNFQASLDGKREKVVMFLIFHGMKYKFSAVWAGCGDAVACRFWIENV